MNCLFYYLFSPFKARSFLDLINTLKKVISFMNMFSILKTIGPLNSQFEDMNIQVIQTLQLNFKFLRIPFP